jgi:hypothetical protein
MSSSAAAIQSQRITTEVQRGGGGARSEGGGTAQRQAHDAAVQKALAALDVQDGKIAAIKAAHTRLKDKLTRSTHTSMLSHRPAATTERAAATATKLDDTEDIKSSIINILTELLNDPEFRLQHY